MRRWRFRFVQLVLLPAIAAAACILGYFTWKTGSQFSRLGEETIAQSTLLIVNEKVDDVEQQIIATDNTVFGLVDLDRPEDIGRTWRPRARDISPGVRAVMILDDTGNVLGYSYRGNSEERREFLKVFLERILPDLELQRQHTGRLKHLHQNVAGHNRLISYEAMRHRGHRYYAVLSHDTDWIVRRQFPRLFATEEGKRLYNVVDEDGHRIYGPNLARAGDYLVGRRFPTTLYSWRLQVAPKQAPLLDAQGRSRRYNEVALVGVAFVIILLGVGFIVYAGEKERMVAALKEEFVANVSHELKTPLSVVRMFAEMLTTKRVRSEEKRQQYLEIICRESERLTGLIENVLDFAALEQGRREYAMADASLMDVVDRAIDAFRYRAEQEGTAVDVEVTGEVPTLRMDEQAILLATVNLLDNAVKHGEQTPISLSIEGSRDEVRVQVKDGGPGIPKEDLKRVFERFYRGRRRGSVRGSGIGLSLVKHIAEAHGGRVWADNAAGGGAMVGFSIPLPTHYKARLR